VPLPRLAALVQGSLGGEWSGCQGSGLQARSFAEEWGVSPVAGDMRTPGRPWDSGLSMEDSCCDCGGDAVLLSHAPSLTESTDASPGDLRSGASTDDISLDRARVLSRAPSMDDDNDAQELSSIMPMGSSESVVGSERGEFQRMFSIDLGSAYEDSQIGSVIAGTEDEGSWAGNLDEAFTLESEPDEPLDCSAEVSPVWQSSALLVKSWQQSDLDAAGQERKTEYFSMGTPGTNPSSSTSPADAASEHHHHNVAVEHDSGTAMKLGARPRVGEDGGCASLPVANLQAILKEEAPRSDEAMWEDLPAAKDQSTRRTSYPPAVDADLSSEPSPIAVPRLQPLRPLHLNEVADSLSVMADLLGDARAAREARKEDRATRHGRSRKPGRTHREGRRFSEVN